MLWCRMVLKISGCIREVDLLQFTKNGAHLHVTAIVLHFYAVVAVHKYEWKSANCNKDTVYQYIISWTYLVNDG